MVPLVFREEVIDPGWDLPKDMEGRIQPGVSIHNKIQRGEAYLVDLMTFINIISVYMSSKNKHDVVKGVNTVYIFWTLLLVVAYHNKSSFLR
jgi:hypothetical protein